MPNLVGSLKFYDTGPTDPTKNSRGHMGVHGHMGIGHNMGEEISGGDRRRDREWKYQSHSVKNT